MSNYNRFSVLNQKLSYSSIPKAKASFNIKKEEFPSLVDSSFISTSIPSLSYTNLSFHPNDNNNTNVSENVLPNGYVRLSYSKNNKLQIQKNTIYDDDDYLNELNDSNMYFANFYENRKKKYIDTWGMDNYFDTLYCYDNMYETDVDEDESLSQYSTSIDSAFDYDEKI
jgi:hypothetical protein